ncbi:autophagy-related protein 13-domain-containing protein [Phlyctochytrium arcticum]|nr:autophagy-related protein 13-domain-containing protein [Phlyctochytrium arcticum]
MQQYSRSPPVRGSLPAMAGSTASLSSSVGAHTNYSTSSRMGAGRAEQIIQNVYSKVAQVVVQSRVTEYALNPNSSGRKLNKWFNLETLDIDNLKEELKFWRAHSVSSAQPPPLMIDVFLDLSGLTPGQSLMLRNETTQRRQRIGHDQLQSVDPVTGNPIEQKAVLLESWVLTLSHPIPSQPPDLPIVYKKSVALFRSLYSYVRLMPTYRLHRRILRQRTGPLRIGYRLSTSRMMPIDEAGLDQLHSSGDMRRGLAECNFGSIDTPFGVFNLHVNYRLECNFSVEDPDAVLGARSADLDENFFTPRSLDRARESIGPSLLNPRRSSSSLSRRGTVSHPEDMVRTGSAGSLSRRVSRFDLQASLHSQDGMGGRSAAPPVNIPPGSLPARGHRHSYSTASTSSSPGVFQFQRTPSPSSHYSSSQQQPNPYVDRRLSWQTSPSANAIAAFTPPSAAFSMGGRQDSDVARFHDPPPFCANIPVSQAPDVAAGHGQLGGDAVSFAAHSPPFAMQTSRRNTLHQHRSSISLSPSPSTDLAKRRPSITFPSASMIPYNPEQSHSPPTFFTPSASTLGRPLHGEYRLSPPPLANPNARPGSSAIDLGEFFRTLELGRRSLKISDNPSHDSTNNEGSCGGSVLSGQEGVGSTSEASLARLSRTKLALARFRQLNELNAAFSDSLSEMAASQDIPFREPALSASGGEDTGPFERQDVPEQHNTHPHMLTPVEELSVNLGESSPRPRMSPDLSSGSELLNSIEAKFEMNTHPHIYANSLPSHLDPGTSAADPVGAYMERSYGERNRVLHRDHDLPARTRRRSVATLVPDYSFDKLPGRPPDPQDMNFPAPGSATRGPVWPSSPEGTSHFSTPPKSPNVSSGAAPPPTEPSTSDSKNPYPAPGWSGTGNYPSAMLPFARAKHGLLQSARSHRSNVHDSSEDDEDLLFSMSGLDIVDSRDGM